MTFNVENGWLPVTDPVSPSHSLCPSALKTFQRAIIGFLRVSVIFSVAPSNWQENPIYAYFPGPPFRPKQQTYAPHTYTIYIPSTLETITKTLRGIRNECKSFGLSSITHSCFTLKCVFSFLF